MPATDREVATYAEHAAAWRTYQPFFPADVRLTEPDLPAEERWTWRGLQVHLDRFIAPDARLTVIVLHGGASYGRLLSSLGKEIRDLGYEAVMPDLPGYGLTAAPAKRVRYGEWVELVCDLIEAERRISGRPVALVGMSMGGMLGWHAAARLRRGTVAGVAATTLIDARDPAVRAAVARWPTVGRLGLPLMRVLRPVLDNLRVSISLVGNVARGVNDPKLARLLARDPQGPGNRVPVGFWRSCMTYPPALEPEAWDRGPVLLAHPGDDRWTPTELSKSFFVRLPEPKRFVELPNCGHVPLEEPGFSLLRQELASFLERLS